MAFFSMKTLLYWINMRKIISLLFIVLLSFAIFPREVSAEQYDNLVSLPADEAQQQELELQAAQGEVLGTNSEVMAEENAISEENGPHFYFGETIVLDENLVGDVYVAGGTVEVNGVIDGDLLIAGGTVTLNGEVTDDVRAAGGTVFINGIIGGNLTLGAGSALFDDETRVGNSIVAGAGEISLNGETIGKVLLGGGAAKIAGTYGSDVTAQADTIRVMPGVVINGSLLADAYTQAEVSDEAAISGEKQVTVTPAEEKQAARENKMDTVGGVLVKATLAEFMAMLVMGIVSGSVFLYFVPKLAQQLADKALNTPVVSAGWGFVYLFLTPIMILITMVSVIALPVAGIVGLFYLISMIGAGWVSAYAVGQKLVANLKVKQLDNKYLTFALGLFVLNAIGFVPVIGWLVKMVAFFVGLGAIFMVIKNTVLSRKASK
jgi:hypothetical protein